MIVYNPTVFAANRIFGAIEPGHALPDEVVARFVVPAELNSKMPPSCQWEETKPGYGEYPGLMYRTRDNSFEVRVKRDDISLLFLTEGDHVLEMTIRVDMYGDVRVLGLIEIDFRLLTGDVSRISLLWKIDEALDGAIVRYLRVAKAWSGYYNIQARAAELLLGAKDALAAKTQEIAE